MTLSLSFWYVHSENLGRKRSHLPEEQEKRGRKGRERRRIQSEPDDGNDVFEVTFDGSLTVIKNALMLGTEEES